jgi:hypothetical protein
MMPGERTTPDVAGPLEDTSVNTLKIAHRRIKKGMSEKTVDRSDLGNLSISPYPEWKLSPPRRMNTSGTCSNEVSCAVAGLEQERPAGSSLTQRGLTPAISTGKTGKKNPVVRWLESGDGEAWSRLYHEIRGFPSTLMCLKEDASEFNFLDSDSPEVEIPLWWR